MLRLAEVWHDGDVSRYFTAAYEERTQLRDGTPIVVRLLRSEDRGLLREGFDRLSPESRYARFFAPKTTLTDEELDYLCNVDQEKHVAIGALHEAEDGTRLGLGIARYIEISPGRAEAAVAVVDEYQGRGLGRLLFMRLCAAARERGITTFTCEVLGSNPSMKYLLDAIAPTHGVQVSQGVVSFDLAVPAIDPTEGISGPPPQGPMYRLFRAAAENVGDWTDTIRNLWARGRTSSEQ